jgi:hypothetical protein
MLFFQPFTCACSLWTLGNTCRDLRQRVSTLVFGELHVDECCCGVITLKVLPKIIKSGTVKFVGNCIDSFLAYFLHVIITRTVDDYSFQNVKAESSSKKECFGVVIPNFPNVKFAISGSENVRESNSDGSFVGSEGDVFRNLLEDLFPELVTFWEVYSAAYLADIQIRRFADFQHVIRTLRLNMRVPDVILPMDNRVLRVEPTDPSPCCMFVTQRAQKTILVERRTFSGSQWSLDLLHLVLKIGRLYCLVSRRSADELFVFPVWTSSVSRFFFTFQSIAFTYEAVMKTFSQSIIGGLSLFEEL